MILTLFLIASQSAFADQALTKRLLMGQKAPYDGALFNDEAVRQIDIDLLEKDMCERHLSDCADTCSGSSFGIQEFALGLLAGGIIGGFVGWTMSH